MQQIVDTHAHLEMPQFDPDREAVLERARAAGLSWVLSIGNARPAENSMEKSIDLCGRYPGLSTTVGIHPHDASLADAGWFRRIAALAADDRVWAVGEIGLDYHYDLSPRDTQRGVFKDLLRLARELGLPVIVHSREAAEDTGAILAEHWALPNPGGIMHCFAGDARLARRCLDLGFCLSFAGNVTFPNARGLREVAATVPGDRLLVETDAPYLAPVPHRGRRNEPAWVRDVAAEVARLRGVDYGEVARQVVANFKNVFLNRFPPVL